MKTIKTVLLLMGMSILLFSQSEKTLNQYSTLEALFNGILDGEVTVEHIIDEGNFGIGTFNSLDGEMIVLDGTAYQIKADGTVLIAAENIKSPFYALTNFEIDKELKLNEELTFNDLQEKINSFIPTENIIYAIRIDGKFANVKTRSVQAQEKPYKKLAEIVKTQVVSEFSDAEGILVGFRCPQYFAGINVPGYHFHFITKDLKRGGHVLDLKTMNAEVKISQIKNYELKLPGSQEFYNTDLSGTETKKLKKVMQE